MEKLLRKYAPKASPRLFFNFGKLNKTTTACKKYFLKKDNLKEDFQKALKKLTLFLLLNQDPFNG